MALKVTAQRALHGEGPIGVTLPRSHSAPLEPNAWMKALERRRRWTGGAIHITGGDAFNASVLGALYVMVQGTKCDGLLNEHHSLCD